MIPCAGISFFLAIFCIKKSEETCARNAVCSRADMSLQNRFAAKTTRR